jgi:hypothetical protein
VATKRNVFRGKNFADPTIKKSRIWLPNLKYELKNKYPPLAKYFTKGYRSVVTYVLYDFCDMSLITYCEIFCSLKFNIVCTCTFFGRYHAFVSPQIGKWSRLWLWLIHKLYWHRTGYCWHCFLVSNISVSHALEMTINFYYPTLELFCFSFTQPFTYSKFCLPNPFLFGATPCHK